MRNVVLCRNFSRRGIRVPLVSNKRNTKLANREAQGEAPERVEEGLNEAAQRLNDSKLQALPAEFETHIE
jgi:hypothetical protein